MFNNSKYFTQQLWLINKILNRLIFFKSGFAAITKNVETINRVMRKPEKIMQKLWITAKVLIVLIKSLVRYSRKWSQSVNYKSKKYELQHLLKSLEWMILGDEIVTRLKSGEDLNSTNLTLAISTWTLKYHNAFQPIFAKIYQDNIDNNNSSELNPKWTPNNWSFKNEDGPWMHFWNLKLRNSAVWKILIGEEFNDNQLSSFDDVSDSKWTGSGTPLKLFKSPEKPNLSFPSESDQYYSQSLTKDTDDSNEAKRIDNRDLVESNIVPRRLITNEEFAWSELNFEKRKLNFKIRKRELTC